MHVAGCHVKNTVYIMHPVCKGRKLYVSFRKCLYCFMLIFLMAEFWSRIICHEGIQIYACLVFSGC